MKEITLQDKEIQRVKIMLSQMGQYTGNQGDILVRIKYPPKEVRNRISAVYKIESRIEQKGHQINRDNVKEELQSTSQEEFDSTFTEIKKWGFRDTVFTTAIWDLRPEYREEIITGLVERGPQEALAKFVHFNRSQLSAEQTARLENRGRHAA